MNLPRIAYSVLGLPTSYYGMTYKDTKLPVPRAQDLEVKIKKAPTSGVLLVSGTAAPIVNQLLEMGGRKVVGLSFSDFYQSKLSNEEAMSTPIAPIVVIYGIGSEPANNTQFASKILNSLLSNYKPCLVILETDKTVNNFQVAYSLAITNVLTIPELDTPKWV